MLNISVGIQEAPSLLFRSTHFRVKTDKNVVKWLCSKKEEEGKFECWIMNLQEFDFKIHPLTAAENVVVDTLSRYLVKCEDCIGVSVCVFKPAG